MEYQCSECKAKWTEAPGRIYCIVFGKIIAKDVNKSQ